MYKQASISPPLPGYSTLCYVMACCYLHPREAQRSVAELEEFASQYTINPNVVRFRGNSLELTPAARQFRDEFGMLIKNHQPTVKHLPGYKTLVFILFSYQIQLSNIIDVGRIDDIAGQNAEEALNTMYNQ
jgi:hypothetical protein